MANKKTSQEVDGVSLKIEDQIRTARSGDNYAIWGSSFLSEGITLQDFYDLKNNDGLVPNKTYYIVDFDSLYFDDNTGQWRNDSRIYVKAYDVGFVYPIALHKDEVGNHFYLTIKDNAPNPLNPDSVWPVEIHRVEDDRGNVYLDTVNGNYGSANPIPTYAQNGKNGRFTNSTFKGQININDGSLNINNSNLIDCNIIGLNLNINNCSIEQGAIESNNSTFINVNFLSFYYYSDGQSTVQGSNIIYGELDTSNNAFINFLNINMNGQYFNIDGKYNDFTNNWKGEVIVSDEYGYSTVKLDTPYDIVHTEGCYSNDTLWLVPNSPIGIYKLQNSGTTSTLTLTYIKNDSSDAIQYKVMNDTTDGTKIDFAMQTSRANIVSAGSSNNRILEYHGATPKVGQLYNNACYAVFRKMWYDNAKSGKCYAIIPDSPHYD